MSVAKVSEISATSTKSFEDAISRPRSQDDSEHRERVDQRTAGSARAGEIVEYQVNMLLTFILDD